jgi:hypothetical protein
MRHLEQESFTFSRGLFAGLGLDELRLQQDDHVLVDVKGV